MKLEDGKKVDVLLVALAERYTSLHHIRQRVESVGLWAMGLSLAAGGWMLQSGMTPSICVKLISGAGVIVAFSVLRLVYLADLRRGFCGQQRVAVSIERALGLFSRDAFDLTGETIYPEKWKDAGTKASDGRFFNSTYTLLWIATAFLLMSIFVSGTYAKPEVSPAPPAPRARGAK